MMDYRKEVNGTILRVIVADITTLEVDAVVNAANQSLLGGGGLDGAIHSAAGPNLLKACEELAGCPAGEAKITLGFELPAEFIIHAVGPVYYDGSESAENKLASAYRNSLLVASENNVKTIAFPSLATGVFAYPIDKASKIAVDEIMNFLSEKDPNKKEEHKFDEIIFCCYSNESAENHIQKLQNR